MIIAERTPDLNLQYARDIMWHKVLSRYEEMYKESDFKGGDEYFAISSIIKGLKTADIACGSGYIERGAPDTVGVDFSIQALKKAKSNGAKYLVRASAEYLPFKTNVFDLTICLGSLEHFKDPRLALHEMARISKIQILTVHSELPFPLSIARKILTRILLSKGQPIEHRYRWKELSKLLKESGLKVVFWGYHEFVGLHYLWENRKWLGRLAMLLRIPRKISIPSHHFVLAYSLGNKNENEI